jgi:hypothetical protein
MPRWRLGIVSPSGPRLRPVAERGQGRQSGRIVSTSRRSVLVIALVVVLLVMAASALGWLSSPGSPQVPASLLPAPSAVPSTAEIASQQPAVGESPAAPTARPSPPATRIRLPGEPARALTPGAANPAVTQSTIRSTICVTGWTATVRPPASYTTALKRRQIVEYGYRDTRLASYEEDHLISLELGGAPRSPANLWPEPYSVTLPDGTPVGARVKDQLENRLHDLVCSGSMRLATAQHLIATDWIGAWRTYVGP